ncbi:PDZ domain-containing protein [Thermoactinomyces mirandus]|uniref:PDZ domain-containing protein n=1 Tax=Thermoactinomyces mirandus TaxID=2756294 RepID=A0A7W2AT96_9BACL|nr:PDZ domain-containing protein [Thermoactinomyces mirandus]MBA4603515.1 PDZ domain-containing protein [Thermoactinomyces mirandus]
MESIWENLLFFWKEWFSALLHPAFLIGFMILLVYFWTLRRYEIKRFSSVLVPKLPLMIQTVSFSIIFGFVGSLCLSELTWEIKTGDLIFVWILTLLLVVFGLRFACLSYSVGILSLIHLSMQQIPFSADFPFLEPLQTFAATDWLWLVGIGHLLEWALIRLDGEDGAYPVKVNQVNGFMLKKGWVIPLLLPNQGGWFPLPIFLSFARLNLSGPMKQQKRQTSTFVLLYGFVLCLGLYFFDGWAPGLWVLAIFAVIGHEGIYLGTKWLEKRAKPLFVSNPNGLKVLAVIPNSPADAMGLKTGDVIQRFNGRRIRNLAELTEMADKATYCKLDVLDEYHDHHITQKALYEDDPVHLGVIPADGVQEQLQQDSSGAVNEERKLLES